MAPLRKTLPAALDVYFVPPESTRSNNLKNNLAEGNRRILGRNILFS
jgi:hypothetical protein